MFERLSEFVNRHEELSLLINDPDIIADQGKWRGLMKEYSDITPIAEKYTEYKNTKKNIEEAIEMLEEKPDEELKSLLKDELYEIMEDLKPRDREVLDLDDVDYLAVVSSQTFDTQGILIECTESRHRLDHFCFRDTAVRQKV